MQTERLKHPNSRPVTIHQAGSFLERAQGKDMGEFFAMGNVSLGAYFKGGESRKIASGLDFDEEKLLLPAIVDYEPEDRNFRKEVALFYSAIHIKVPYSTGVTLETGLKGDNDKPLSKDNMPIDIEDYIKYRQILGNPLVAKSKEESDSNPTKEFYIFDPTKTKERNASVRKEKDAAQHIYLTVKKDSSKVDMMLTLLSIDPREFSGPDAADRKIEKLHEQADKNPKRFISLYEEEDMEIRYWINSMINTGVLKNLNNKIVDGETKKIIGTMEEMISFFKDDTHSDDVVMLKARLQEAMATPLAPTTRRTVLPNR